VKLADDHIAIKLGAELITLRPTLRCGLRLERRREGSFAKLIEDLQSGSLTAAQYVISDHYQHMALGHQILDAGLEEVCLQLTAFVLQCSGIDPDADGKGGESVSFSEHLTSLYRIGTGWLGWTPETTLDSTPVEIAQAYLGRIDMLKAIFGGEKSEAKASPSKNMSAANIREVFRDMGAEAVKKRKGK
jgi:hypothetical protein